MWPVGVVTPNLVFAIFSGAFGSAFQHGFNTGVLNEIQNVTMEWIRNCKKSTSSSVSADEDCAYGLSETTLIYAWVVSVFCLGGMVGGLSVAPVGRLFGRKKALIYNNFFVLTGGILMGTAKFSGYFSSLILGRFVIGIACGLAAGLTPMYLTEISPPTVRGAIGTVYQLIITISIWVSEYLGVSNLLGGEDLWPFLLLFTIVPGLLQMCLLPMCPESPTYLFTKLDKDKAEDAARESLHWLRGKVDVEHELLELKKERLEAEAGAKFSIFDLFKKSSLRKPLNVAIMMMLAQQFTGINAIIFYSTDVFRGVGLTLDDAQYATIVLGAANVVVTIFAIFSIDKAGRKTMLLVGLIGMLLSTAVLFSCLMKGTDSGPGVAKLSVLALVGYIVCFAIGPGPIPWFFVQELFAAKYRSSATSVAVAVNWTANFTVSWAFQPLATVIGPYVFLIFILVMAYFIFYIWKRVPETKDKTIAEIGALFNE